MDHVIRKGTADQIRKILSKSSRARYSYEVYSYVNSCFRMEITIFEDLDVEDLGWLTHQFAQLMIDRGARFTSETLVKIVPITGVDADFIATKALDLGSQNEVMEAAIAARRKDVVLQLGMRMRALE